MPNWSNHATVAAARNGTTDHTVQADGTGGSVVDGSAFTPTSGRLLLCFVGASATSTTPTGWTLPTNGNAVGNTGLYIFYRTANGTSADQVATTHNASNYPAVFDFYEFNTGSTFTNVVKATAVNANGGAGPTLSGLTGTNWTSGIVCQAEPSTTTPDSFTWATGAEEVDTSVLTASGTNGYTYSLTYDDSNTATSVSYVATGTRLATTVERLVVAVAAVAVTDPVIMMRPLVVVP